MDLINAQKIVADYEALRTRLFAAYENGTAPLIEGPPDLTNLRETDIASIEFEGGKIICSGRPWTWITATEGSYERFAFEMSI